MLPHIVHFLADDLGWADVGYHRAPNDTDVNTTHIDALARGGVRLERFYAFKYCSPSRSALQTGRNPIHVNVQNVDPDVSNPDDPIGGWQGIPTNMTGIASVLRRAGYRTALVGKWDVGMATAAHHPRARGYERWLGYWHHANDYWQLTEDACAGKAVRDLWRFNATHDAPALALSNGGSCSQAEQSPAGERCVFEEDELLAEALDVVATHDVASPLFLFYSSHLVHMPLQAPQDYVDRFAFIANSYRRLNHAMGAYLDAAVGSLVAALQARAMWSSTLFVFHSDNGGEIMGGGICGGNNWPLTGGKFSNWEGGVRVNAFVAGGVLPAAMRGTTLHEYVTVWDWYSTYAAIAGVDPTDHVAAAAGLPPIDSVNQWPLLSGANATAPRRSIVLGDTSALEPGADGDTLVGGLIDGDLKLLVGAADRVHTIGQYVQTGPSWPNETSHLVPTLHVKTCGRELRHGCLFNITADPEEQVNLASAMPDAWAAMLKRVDEEQAGVYSPKRGVKDPRACEVATGAYGGWWAPFA